MSNISKARDITHFGTALLAKDPVWKLWRAIVIKLYPDSENVAPVPFSELSNEAQTFFFVEELNREVLNGGFNQYFLNSSGSNALLAKDALVTIGALKTHDLLSQALTIFPPDFSIDDEHARWELIVKLENDKNSILDELDTKYDSKIRTHRNDEPAEEDLWQLCVDFIEKNISTLIIKNNG